MKYKCCFAFFSAILLWCASSSIVLAGSPDPVEIASIKQLVVQGKCFYEQNHYDDALRAFIQAEQLFPKKDNILDAELWQIIGYCYLQLRAFVNAETVFNVSCDKYMKQGAFGLCGAAESFDAMAQLTKEGNNKSLSLKYLKQALKCSILDPSPQALRTAQYATKRLVYMNQLTNTQSGDSIYAGIISDLTQMKSSKAVTHVDELLESTFNTWRSDPDVVVGQTKTYEESWQSVYGTRPVQLRPNTSTCEGTNADPFTYDTAWSRAIKSIENDMNIFGKKST